MVWADLILAATHRLFGDLRERQSILSPFQHDPVTVNTLTDAVRVEGDTGGIGRRVKRTGTY